MRKNRNWIRRQKVRNTPKRRTKLRVSFSLIMLLSFVVSAYSNQDNLTLKKHLNPTTMDTIDAIKLPEQEKFLSDDSLKSETNKIGITFVLFSILTLLISTILLSLIWSYLNNVSITKRCLLLYLYQDAIAITLMASYIWVAIIISCFSNANGFMSNRTEATILSICLISVEIALILIVNLVSLIKIYTMKEKVIDPPMPWNHDDDNVMKELRMIIALSITLFVSAMYSQGLYPKAYYYFIGDHTPLLDLSIGPKIFEGVLGVLFIVPTFTIILASRYRQTEEQALATRREGKVYFLVVTFILIMVSGVVYGAFSDQLGHFLIVGQCLVTVAMVVTPTFIILSSHPLKAFCQKVVLSFSSSMMDKINSYQSRVQACINSHQRSRQIVPIV